MNNYSKEDVTKKVIAIIEEMTSDWDVEDMDDGITEDTKLVADLAFESVEIVQLMVTLEQSFGLKNMPSEKLLMKDGRHVAELKIPEISDFVYDQLNA